MPAGGTNEEPMTDHDATSGHDTATPAQDPITPAGAHDDGHTGGHDDHHDEGSLGPIAWRMWGVGVLGVVAALIVIAAFVVATDFVFLTPAA
jgi:hypothetical protein